MTDIVEILRGLGMDDVAEEIERLRARILELEATIAAARGTFSQTQTQGPAIFGVTYGVTPNTPR